MVGRFRGRSTSSQGERINSATKCTLQSTAVCVDVVLGSAVLLKQTFQVTLAATIFARNESAFRELQMYFIERRQPESHVRLFHERHCVYASAPRTSLFRLIFFTGHGSQKLSALDFHAESPTWSFWTPQRRRDRLLQPSDRLPPCCRHHAMRKCRPRLVCVLGCECKQPADDDRALLCLNYLP